MATDPMIGIELEQYRLDELLGAGSYGRVYRATDLRLDRPCAVKVLNVWQIRSAHAALPQPLVQQAIQDAGERFVREARIAGKLDHPNIIQIYNVGAIPLPGDDDGKAWHLTFIAMPLLAGVSLRQVLKRQPRIPFDRARRLLTQMADALDFAHQHQIVHRDVKPENTFVAPDDHVTLVDFGLARAAPAIAALGSTDIQRSPSGTLPYLAPEVTAATETTPEQRQELGKSGDRYALGVVAYELLCGRLPFEGDALSQWHAGTLAGPADPRRLRPDLPPDAPAVLLRQLSRDPAQRYPSARAFVNALGAALSEPVAGSGPLANPRPRSDDGGPAQIARELLQTTARKQNLVKERKRLAIAAVTCGTFTLLSLFILVSDLDPATFLVMGACAVFLGLACRALVISFWQRTKEIAKLDDVETAQREKLRRAEAAAHASDDVISL